MISDALASWQQEITLLRYSGNATVSAGRVTAPAPVTTQILAAVVPLVGDALLRLPEGDRKRKSLRVITSAELRATSGAPDELSVDGNLYTVIDVAFWAQGTFYDAICVRKAVA